MASYLCKPICSELAESDKHLTPKKAKLHPAAEQTQEQPSLWPADPRPGQPPSNCLNDPSSPNEPEDRSTDRCRRLRTDDAEKIWLPSRKLLGVLSDDLPEAVKAAAEVTAEAQHERSMLVLTFQESALVLHV